VTAILPVHIIGGVLALAGGYVALAAAKGSTLHRTSGRVFVGAMLVMALTGAFVALASGSAISVVAGLLTFYFVTTGLLTVRRGPRDARIDRAAMMFAFSVALGAFVSGVANAGPEAAPAFIFGLVGLLAARGDRQRLRSGAFDGSQRIARHLWRMCFAMWVAAASFFWGPRGRVPEPLRVPALQGFAVLLPVAVMIYWLWRLRARRRRTHADPILALKMKEQVS
jgi:uncharacterized membrane protein